MRQGPDARRARLGPGLPESDGGRRRRLATARSSARAGTRARGPRTPRSWRSRGRGDRARGATLYCTLEPCDQLGRTPPCTRALIAAGVGAGRRRPPIRSRTWATARRARASCARAGIAVAGGRAGGRGAAPERGVRAPRAPPALPFVTLKIGRDASTARSRPRDGSSRWITGEAARAGRPAAARRRRRRHRRGGHGARGRPRAHRPRPSVRAARRAPLRVVVDSAGRRAARRAAVRRVRHPRWWRPRRRGRRRRAWPVGRGGRRGRRAAIATPRRRRRCDALVRAARRSASVQGSWWRAVPTLAWSFVRDGLVDKVVCTSRRSCSAASRRPASLGGRGFAPVDRGAADSTFDRVERLGRRPEGGGVCSPGSLRSSGACPPMTGAPAARGRPHDRSRDSGIGASVAVNGVCLTVVERTRGRQARVRPLRGDARPHQPRRLRPGDRGEPGAAGDPRRPAGRPHRPGPRRRRRRRSRTSGEPDEATGGARVRVRVPRRARCGTSWRRVDHGRRREPHRGRRSTRTHHDRADPPHAGRSRRSATRRRATR